MTTFKPRVLVIGINQSLVWNVAHSLAKKHIKAVVLAAQAFAPLMLSTSCATYIQWKNARLIDDELDLSILSQVEDLCHQYHIDIVIPADYESALLLGQKPASSQIPVCIIPNPTTIKLVHNKWHLYNLLKALNIPCPESEYIASSEALLKTKLSFPIITKPLDKWASIGFEIHLSLEELTYRVKAQELKSSFPLIAQTFASGWDVGLSFLADKGNIIAFCMFHANKKRIRTFFEDQHFLEQIARLIKETNYSGVGNLDAIYNPTKHEYKVLELNPRFWASQLYASNADLNFPYLVANPHLWQTKEVFKARLGDAKPTTYERLMSFSTRRINHLYDKMAS